MIELRTSLTTEINTCVTRGRLYAADAVMNRACYFIVDIECDYTKNIHIHNSVFPAPETSVPAQKCPINNV